MYDNRNIYDLFNARKNNIDNCVESLAFDNIDDGLIAMESMIMEMEASSIEFQSACYMEDLVFEAMIYENFDECEIGAILEAAQEGRMDKVKERLRAIWNKIKEWLKAIIDAIKKFFISCKNAVRNAIDKLMGRKKKGDDKGEEPKGGEAPKGEEPKGAKGGEAPKGEEPKGTKGGAAATREKIKNRLALNAPDSKGGEAPKGNNQKALNAPNQKALNAPGDSISDIYERRRKAKLNPNRTLPGPEGKEEKAPKNEDEAIRNQFRNSKEGVEVMKYNDIDQAMGKTEQFLNLCITPGTYNGPKSIDELFKKFNIRNLSNVKHKIRSYFIADSTRKYVAVSSLNVNELKSVVDMGDKFIGYLQDVEKKGSTGLERIIGTVNDNINGNREVQQIAINIEMGLKIFNTGVQEAISCVRQQVNDYTRILTHVLGK